MATTSPIRPSHLEHEASFIRFGEGDVGAEVVETFGPLELEYAAIRRGCALFDMTQRGCVRVTGEERIDFLNRMLTQELNGLAPGRSAPSFWLNRKGRIDADLRVVHTEHATWLALDTLCAQRTVDTLDGYLFAEDVAIENATEGRHTLTLAGPTALQVFASLGATPPTDTGACLESTLAGANVVIDRHDALAAPTFDVSMDATDVARVYEALIASDDALRVRRAGWHAYNIARIEAGTPLYHLDFGPDSLPAESGVLRDHVDFKKGCYLGQEVVARMDALGHPKQTLCALRLPSADLAHPDDQPMTGAPIFEPGDDPAGAKPVGAITSSTRSPMLGDDVCCFAQARWERAQPGAGVLVMTGAGPIACTVREGLRFYEPASAQSS